MSAELSIELINFEEEYYYNSGCEITITWESARFIRIKSIQESFIIWAYIVYIFTIQW